MPSLVDTNLLLRSMEPGHPMHAEALDALQALREQGDQPCLVAQNLIEFWAVATRPQTRNGLGMPAVDAQVEIAHIETLFRVLPDTPDIYNEWKRLVTSYGIVGVGVYDTRLVAAMLTHGIPRLVTFNVDDFRRYAEITVTHPRDVR